MVSFRNDILPLKNQLFRLALRITLDRAEAEDIVQDTLIKVWNRRDSWDTIDNVESFCFTVCRNLALDSLKRRSNSNVSLDEAIDAGTSMPQAGTDNDTPAQHTIINNQLTIVRRIVDSLPEKQRSCIQLRDFEGKSYKEIAKILDISEGQVRINIFRGRQTIKQKFESIENYGRN